MSDALKRFIAERRSIAEAGTAGSWKYTPGQDVVGVVDVYGDFTDVICHVSYERTKKTDADLSFIADARNCMSILLQIIEAQDEALRWYSDLSNHLTSDGRPPATGWTNAGDDAGAFATEVRAQVAAVTVSDPGEVGPHQVDKT